MFLGIYVERKKKTYALEVEERMVEAAALQAMGILGLRAHRIFVFEHPFAYAKYSPFQFFATCDEFLEAMRNLDE